MNIPYVALKNLERKPTRTLLLISIVAVVSCTLFAATLFLNSVNNALITGAYRLGADILVVPENAEGITRTALLSGEPTQFLMERSILDRVRSTAGVKAVTPQIFIKPASFFCCLTENVFLVAFDPETDFTIKPWLEKKVGRKLSVNEVIIGGRIPVIAGDMLPFFGTHFIVAGILEPTGMNFVDRTVFMSMEAAYAMAENSKVRAVQPLEIGRDRISTVLVKVKDDMSPDRVAVRIEHDIPEVKALVSDTVISTVRKQLSGLIRAIFSISGILWLIVLLIMAFTFYMIVNERRREIGLLRAMGANKGHISAIILTEASLLSSCGGAAGILLGFGLLASLKNPILHHLKLPYLFPSPVTFAALVAGALILSIMTGLLSGLLPSLAVLRMEPYDAIRREE
ncbi:MAG TPA: FtsX-like permease family protein [Nitrospirota bacterium]|nr:FtsX-like permease family protein [Nitrospirota bacterium]